MTTVPQPVPQSAPRNTYTILKLTRTSVLALTALLLLALLTGAHVHRAAMQTVGVDAAPSIIAAQHIKASLADMDANEANELLAPAGKSQAAMAGIVKRQAEEEEALVEAARNITYEAEKPPIETLQVKGGLYLRLAQKAEDAHDSRSPDEVPDYRAEAILMDGTLLPAADALDKANDVELTRTYNAQEAESGWSTAFVIVAGLLLLGALVWVQLFLSTRTRRTLNPFLALGTLAAFGLLAYALLAMTTEQHELKVAKEEAFDSIHALWRARAVAYQANAEESRFLVDHAHADEYQAGFFDESNRLVHLPPGLTFDELVNRERKGEHVAGFTGYLADELNNITFGPREQDAAIDTLEAYGQYLTVDTQIRTLERNAQHPQAIELCVGSAVGQSNWAFEKFDLALEETLAINQNAFNASVEAGLSAVGKLGAHATVAAVFSTLEFKGLVAAILIAVFTLLGFAPRIREYE